jgi:hypothetical protein
MSRSFEMLKTATRALRQSAVNRREYVLQPPNRITQCR